MKEQANQKRVEIHIDLPQRIYSQLKLQSSQTGLPIEAIIYSVLRRDVFGPSPRKTETS